MFHLKCAVAAHCTFLEAKSSTEKGAAFMYCAVLCCAVLCCAVLCCFVLCCAKLFSAHCTVCAVPYLLYFAVLYVQCLCCCVLSNPPRAHPAPSALHTTPHTQLDIRTYTVFVHTLRQTIPHTRSTPLWCVRSTFTGSIRSVNASCLTSGNHGNMRIPKSIPTY